MSCETYGNLTICRPNPAGEKVRILMCPKCNKRRRVIVKFYESYASHFGIGRCTGKRKKWKHLAACGYEWGFGE